MGSNYALKHIMVKFLVIGIPLILSGCSFTKFESDADETVFVLNYSHSERFVDGESPMGRITSERVDNKSDIARIATSDENVVWVPRVYASGSEDSIPVGKKTTLIDSSEEKGREICTARNGNVCQKYKSFDLYDDMADVPGRPSGEIMTCTVKNDSNVYSCKKGMADCLVGKLGEYCLRDK